MAGVGFDGAMIRDAERDLKDRFGKLAYVWTGLRHVDGAAPRAQVRIDGSEWFDGEASCVLVGNVGTITGGIEAFDDARPDDGWLDVGVATAQGAAQWARTLGRMAVGRSDASPFVRMTRARKIDIKLHAPMVYELDGGAREAVQRLKVRVIPGGVTICVPDPAPNRERAETPADETATT
jgi:diacylglycerol kinase (ATP)